jgi:hypothetical protein
MSGRYLKKVPTVIFKTVLVYRSFTPVNFFLKKYGKVLFVVLCSIFAAVFECSDDKYKSFR